MNRLVEKAGVSGIIALVAAIVIAYSFWGAYILKHSGQKGMFSQGTANSLTANI